MSLSYLHVHTQSVIRLSLLKEDLGNTTIRVIAFYVVVLGLKQACPTRRSRDDFWSIS
jgi:hypothetical protein